MSDQQLQLNAVVGKSAKRLMPFLALIFLLNFIDRANVSFAALTMNKDLGFTPTIYAWGVGFFFFGYVLFEVPSNMMVERVGARRWIAPLTIGWGIVASLMAFTHDANSFFALRFLLGAFEAGLLPGLLLYLTYWFPAEYRARMSSFIMAAIPVALVVNGPLAGVILGTPVFAGLGGFKSWQWLFIIEGIATVIAGLFVLKMMPDRPSKASWLTAQESALLENALQREAIAIGPSHGTRLIEGLVSRPVLVLSLAYFGSLMGGFGIIFWVPQIVRAFGLSNLETGFVSALPFAIGLIATVLIGRIVDRTNRGPLIVGLGMSAGALGLLVSGLTTEPVITLAALCVASAGIFGVSGAFWTLPPRILKGRAIVGAFAMINSVGALGGFVGPYIIGWSKQETGAFSSGLMVLAIGPIISAIMIAWLSRLFTPSLGGQARPADVR